MNHVIEIPINGLFNVKECLWFLNRGFDDCMYEVYPDKVRRAFKFAGKIMLVDIYLLPDKLLLKWLSDEPTEEATLAIVDFVTEWFDLHADLNAFYQVITADERLTYMTEEYRGLRSIGMPDLFEALCWGIIGQQINLKFAYTIKRKLVEKYGDFITYNDKRYYTFPTAETLTCAIKSELREMQLSEKKAEYLVTIAQAFTSGTISKDILLKLPDFESRAKLLTAIKGIGTWTANYALMKSMRERSSVPYGDAGLLNALVNHNFIENKGDNEAVVQFFSKFPGWEAYLVFYLWRTLAVPKIEG
jgi:DNA-3-methyladenine glycosylase II